MTVTGTELNLRSNPQKFGYNLQISLKETFTTGKLNLIVTRGSLAKQIDCFCMAKTKRPKRKMVLAPYNGKKILPRYPVNLKLYRKKKLENLKWFRRYKQF